MKLPLVFCAFLCSQVHALFPVFAEGNAPSLPWNRVELISADHGPLLEKQAKLDPNLVRSPATISVIVLEPDWLGQVSEVTVNYDTMEGPSEATVLVTESGILDDDLFAIRHEIQLARNRNDEWRIVAYRRGELRRHHFQSGG